MRQKKMGELSTEEVLEKYEQALESCRPIVKKWRECETREDGLGKLVFENVLLPWAEALLHHDVRQKLNFSCSCGLGGHPSFCACPIRKHILAAKKEGLFDDGEYARKHETAFLMAGARPRRSV